MKVTYKWNPPEAEETARKLDAFIAERLQEHWKRVDNVVGIRGAFLDVPLLINRSWEQFNSEVDPLVKLRNELEVCKMIDTVILDEIETEAAKLAKEARATLDGRETAANRCPMVAGSNPAPGTNNQEES